MARSRLVGDSVPMLINGVSQQSEMVRLPTQVTEQINCTSSIVRGLSKRPPSEFIARLGSNRDWTDSKVHFISRDENENYIVIVESENIRVFDLEGNEHEVDLFGNGSYLNLESSDTYSSPISAFRLHTIADTTFIVNRNKVVSMHDPGRASESTPGTIYAPSNKPYRALVWIKSAKVNKLHSITIKAPDRTGTGRDLNLTVSYKPSADDTTNLNHSAAMLARELKRAFENEDLGTDFKTYWKVGNHTNIVYIESAEDDFIIEASNDWSDTYVSTIKDSVGGVAELPSRGFPDMRIKVTGDVEDSSQGFWVKFVPDNEDLQQLDGADGYSGFNTVSFDGADVEPTIGEGESATVQNKAIRVRNHPFTSKPQGALTTNTSNISGGERELVQYRQGSFEIGGLTDKKFYFVEPELQNGLPHDNTDEKAGLIKLSDDASLNTTGDDGIEKAGSEINVNGTTGCDKASEVFDATSSGTIEVDLTEAGGVVTIDLKNDHHWVVGDIVAVEGIDRLGSTGFDGDFVLTAVGAQTISYAAPASTNTTSINLTETTEKISGAYSVYKKAELVRIRVMNGKWVESVAPSIDKDLPLTFDGSTMPHFLVRTKEQDADGRFKFKLLGNQLDTTTFPLLKWGARIVGDEDSAPDPSFVGHTINDVFEWRQSLGLASGQNFVLSERSHYFNFWPITVASALDDARIDVAASGSNMSNFHSVRVFQDELVGFTTDGQFTLSSSGTTLTPQTVSLAQTTKFESSELAQPVNIGSSIAFPTSKGSFSSISEYFVREDQMAYINENTRHVGHYIAGNVTSMSVSPVSDSLIVLTDADRKALYYYKWFWQGNEKVQSAWSKWTFGSNIIAAFFAKDILYLIAQDTSGTPYPELYKVITTEGDIDTGGTYKTALDRRHLLLEETSDTLALPYKADADTLRVVDDRGRVLTVASTAIDATSNQTTVTLSEPVPLKSDGTKHNVYVGESYDSQVELTRPVVRTRYKETVDLRTRLQVRDYVLYHEDTGYFKVKVYPRSYTTTPYEYEMGSVLGGTTVGTAPISSGKFQVPIRADARDMRMVIHNDSHLPHHLVSAEWSANYNPKVYRQ